MDVAFPIAFSASKTVSINFLPVKITSQLKQAQPLSGVHIPVSATQLALAPTGVWVPPVVTGLAERSGRY